MIETTITKIQYDADGVQRRWTIPFPYVNVKHISIYTKVGDEPTVKVVDNYEIDEDDSVVIYPTVASGQEPLAAGTKITIARETPETQLEDSTQIHFTSSDVERGLDKLTMIVQELSTTSGETMEVSAAAFETAEEAVNTANEANTTAQEAKTLAEQAVSTANDANATANAADAKADNAVSTANDANEKSTAAVSAANATKTIASEANNTANEALGIAKEAKATSAEANTTANSAKKTASDADKKADNAVSTANNAKDVADGIDAKATEALTNSTAAVNTANSAKQTAEGIDSKATQALENSTDALAKATEAKNTADSCQGQITTLRNDVDDLGDQVAAIEGKIPAEASTTNQLADKTFVTTITDELAADITALEADKQDKLTTVQLSAVNSGITSDKVTQYNNYATTKQDKLTAGDNITISADNVISATGGGETPTNMVTTDTYQDISARKNFTDQIEFSGGLRSNHYYSKNNSQIAADNGSRVILGENDMGIEIFSNTSLNITTKHQNSGALRPATLNGKQIATVDDIAAAGGDNGIKGDYCTTYGILEAPNGILTNPSGMQVTLKQGVVLQLAGQDIKTTVSGDMTQTLTSAADCDLFYVSGTTSLMEVAQIVWSKTEPDNGATGVLAWWNPDNGKWKFKSNDTGNVWAEAVATPVAHIHTNGTVITRVDHIGYRILNDEVYALKSEVANLPLLSFQWFEHLLEDMSWLRTDTFSWQDGTVYTAAYNELLTEYNNAASADETDGSISFKRTPKGYKICGADQHDNVAALYESTGVAWYYILDVPNKRFKLPRTKFGFTGLRTGAGNYVAPGLPNITGTLETIPVSTTIDGKGAFRRSTTPYTVGASAGGASWSNVTFDASLSNPTYGSSTTVQPPATEMYLYFFVGNYTQTAIEQTAGLNAEMFNGKADVEALNGKANTDLANVASNIDYVVESYSDNDGNWYRVWKSKRVEQGGVTALIPSGTGITITFFKEFANISYTIISTPYGAYSNTGMANNPVTQKLTTSFNQTSGSTPSASFSWYACGQGAE